ncbi:MAG: hypothetical protein FJ014_10205 [Chloroflexi bacterium]|nr:hypothetical protein [Chloroflexota bacterium]
MYINAYEAEMLMRERTKNAFHEAERERLGRMANPARVGLLDPVLASVGGLMITAGKKLQARRAPLQSGLTGAPSPARQ